MSTKKNIQAFREWAYENNAFKREPTTVTAFTDPMLNSKQRQSLKWRSKNA